MFGPPEPSTVTDDPVVAAAMAEVMQTGQPLSPGNQTPPDVLTVRITSLALGLGNAPAIRIAVAHLGALFPQGYEVLHWAHAFN